MPATVLVASLAVTAGLALLAAGVRRVPAAHFAVVHRRGRCRPLRIVAGRAWVVPGTGRLVLVELGRRQFSYTPEWHALSDGHGVRLGMTLGVTVGDPCAVAALDLAASIEGRRTWFRPHVVSSLDWVGDQVRAAMPPVVRDVVAELGPYADLAPDRSRWWPLVRRGLADALANNGLVVQEVWLRELGAGTAAASMIHSDDRAAPSPSGSAA